MSQPRRSRLVILLPFLLLVAAGATVALIRPGSSPVASQAQTTVDPRLVLHPTTIGLSGTLSGAPFTGTISPAIPGPNRLRITLHPSRSTSPQPASLRVEATMPGMKMSPAHATLYSTGRTYVGTIDLAMFGRYALHVTGPAHHAGSAIVTLPLPVH